ncbi:hypothetical protein N7537_012074 [Penicillium hordei]|uniref:BHLH domain-containing protein n=1 Tax=Penicillium hordei TaxID=40994 RepID=A0AAD6GSC1_9EURO|nr:uncharacterized protein N7537_012074 [Penicillium hordei]KAJ5589396.1 hypothetical protein N7537_012074 [Penicillium hordei]
MAHVHANAQPTRADSGQTRSSYPLNRKRQLAEIRPKGGSLLIMTNPNSTETRRRQHADAQKCQRDRMKAALGQIEQIMRMGGAGNDGTSGTKAELLETAVEYIQHLQKQVEELRELGHGGHATPDVDVQRCAGCQNQSRGSMSVI